MMPDLLQRLMIAALIVAAGLASFGLYQYALRRRLQAQRISVQGGRPVLLYFTTPTCAPCKTIQRPSIEKIQAELGERLQVIEIDASENPSEADRWGVLSVPTTILLDREGRARNINHGVATATRLMQQVRKILE